MSLSIDLSGKSALVTGAASGVGRAVAEDLGAHGACVLLADLNEAEGQPVASRIPNALFQHADISSRDDCQALVARASEAWGGLDILVNNAGIQHIAPVAEFPQDRWELLEGERPTWNGQHGLPGDLGRNETGIWLRRNDEYESQ